ncbi:DNA (cytosine-5-)-methyltransferase [Alteromonas facilis]|uniref:DNA (cytosine-5-)-methyltransferase n=1 Tax=Alteromonas facilis TaxID=2048004 RepID=UPI000C294698|nr:DNA (cytosine-5-)-methyltransferase [Alteromonas facilis]
MKHKNPSNDNHNQIKCIREKLGLGRTEFANLLGLGTQGERTIRGWETGEHKPSAKKVAQILALEDELHRAKRSAPFYSEQLDPAFRFIDLFAGIGGIRLPFQNLGGKCVFTSEWDKFAQKTYLANFGEMPNGDITMIRATDIPDHDVLLGGFPCQAFSQAGLKKGFNDTRGTMFFEIQRILVEKRPKAFLLENVKQLKGHDKGRTLKTIMAILRGENETEMPQDIPLSDEARHALSEKLNYWVDFKVLRAADFGVPQNRERVFLIGFDKDFYSESDIKSMFRWPVPPKTKTRVGTILEDLKEISAADDKFTISDKLWEGHQKRKAEHLEKGNGFGYSLFNADSEYTSTISARYYKDGSEILIDQSELGKNPRKLTPRECARLQGFPENYIVDAVSKGQIYKQFGNSVCINVISAVADSMVSFMKLVEEKRYVA